MRNLASPVNGRLGYPLGFAAAIVVTIVAVAAHGTGHPEWVLAALTATVAAVATVTTFPAALATAAVAWALQAGFVLGRLGDLVFTVASLAAAVALLTAALVAYTAATAVRHVRRPADVQIPRPRRPLTTANSPRHVA